jgi:hypothetical protein
MTVAALNELAVFKLRQGCASTALLLLHKAIKILTTKGISLDDYCLWASDPPGAATSECPNHPWETNFVYTTETTAVQATRPTLANSFQNVLRVAILVPPRSGSDPASEHTVFVNFRRCDSVNRQGRHILRNSGAAFSAILLYHIGFAYHQQGIARNCYHSFSQALEKYEMTQTLLTPFINKEDTSPSSFLLDLLRQLVHISGLRQNQIHLVVFGIAPAA